MQVCIKHKTQHPPYEEQSLLGPEQMEEHSVENWAQETLDFGIWIYSRRGKEVFSPCELFKVVASKYWESTPVKCFPTNNDSLLLYGNNTALQRRKRCIFILQRGRGNPYGLIVEPPLHVLTPPSLPWWAWVSEELSPKATREQPWQPNKHILFWH